MNQDKTTHSQSKFSPREIVSFISRGEPHYVLILTAAAFALLQIGIAGYSIGVGNQTIQIPFVQRFADGGLYAKDVALNKTIDQYPSYAYRLLALFYRLVDYKIVYAFFHLLSGFLLALAILHASLVLWSSLGPGLISLTILLAGHHRALAGAELYVAGFTHTWFSFPLAVWSFVFLWQKRFTLSLITVGLLFNLHALIAAYAAVFLLAMYVSSCSLRSPMRRAIPRIGATSSYGRLRWFSAQFKDWRRLMSSGLLAVVCALPTLVSMMAHTAEFSNRWFALTYIRSAYHSFPLSLWQSGDISIPRFASIIGLSILCIPLLRDYLHRRMMIAVIMATIAMFAVGVLATDYPIVLRAQLWRASGFPLLLAILVIAHGLWRCWQPDHEGHESFHGLILALTVLVCTVPALINNVYLCFVLLTISACLMAIISWQLALLVSMCHVVCLSAIFFIGFPFLQLPGNPGLANIETLHFVRGHAWQIVLVILCLGILGLSYFVWLGRNRRLCLGFGGMLLALTCGLVLWHMLAPEENDWVDAQKWARTNTPQDAVFLTPIHRSGFRIHSQRAVVTEWRDGTLLYFAPDFADEWWQRVKAAQPGIEMDEEKRRLLQPGLDYSVLSDEQLIRLCDRYHVDFLLLPKSYLGNLQIVYSNQAWHIARPEFPPPKPVPSGVKDEATWHAQEAFMRDVVEPNIEKYRKGDLTIELRDADGKAVYDLKYQLELTKHAFHFGSGLGFFVEPPEKPDYDFIPSVVTAVDKKHFLEVFNFSIIPYSAKWFYLEPEEGKTFYDDLDAYVNWCLENKIDIEYHFVTGYPPKWLEIKSQAEKQQLLLKHSNELIDRYGGKIHYWQVVNEKHLLTESVAAFKLFRRRLPDAKLGISDCARFYSPHQTDSQARFDDLTRGLAEIRWLKEQGVELDFFGFHAHRPFGLWADFRVLYEVLDLFEKEGIRIHISEFGIHEAHNIEGDVREGQWNADLQGRYYEMIYSAMFSHPVVDAINLWGMSGNTWMTGSGLLDKDGQPKPSFYALRNLIHQKWHTSKKGVLPLNGKINCRAFYGAYILRLELEDGKTIEIHFQHRRGETKPLIFSLSR